MVINVFRKNKYILFLDDDVGLYRTTFRDLVLELENDDHVGFFLLICNVVSQLNVAFRFRCLLPLDSLMTG